MPACHTPNVYLMQLLNDGIEGFKGFRVSKAIDCSHIRGL